MAGVLFKDEDSWGSMVCKIVAILETLSLRVLLTNEAVSVLITPATLASIRAAGHMRESTFADHRHPDILWVCAFWRR